MNIKRIAAISLTYDDFPSFEAKLVEAARYTLSSASDGSMYSLVMKQACCPFLSTCL